MKKINVKYIPVICVFITILAAGILLWVNSLTAVQAQGIVYPKVIFQGEYKIGDGEWQKYEPQIHLSASKGDITLKGTFQMQLEKPGEMVGSVCKGNIITLYCDHLMVKIQEEGFEPVFLETELKDYKITCAKIWQYYTYQGDENGEVEIWIHNPHKFGNENAVDELLENMYLYAGYEFDEDRIQEGSWQRIAGIVILLSASCMLGISVFAGRIHIQGNRVLWTLGFFTVFAGGYIILSSPNINLWNPAYSFNTIALGVCMMLYQFLGTTLILLILGDRVIKFAKCIVYVSGVIPAILLGVSMMRGIHFYGTWGIWALVESVVCILLLFCVCYDLREWDKKKVVMQLAAVAALLSFLLDVIATAAGWWQGGKASTLVFLILLLAIFIVVVRVIPEKINEVARAKELEEKQKELQQELKDRRVSMMMSQIRTHFIFNVMTIISGLCNTDPQKADDALILFARYLRKNIAIMDRDEPIFFSDELRHLEDYISLEKMRFGDRISFEKYLEITEFKIPPLTIQPMVENAIKHGLLAHGKKGTVTLRTKEEEKEILILVEDDGAGFSMEELEKTEAVGIRNVRYRVENMLGGSLEVTSVLTQGTKVSIRLPKKM